MRSHTATASLKRTPWSGGGAMGVAETIGAYSSIDAASTASRARRALARSLTLSERNCPQAAKMSRPRGVRIGEA